MPPFPQPLRLANSSHGHQLPGHDTCTDQSSHVVLTAEAEGALAELHSAITNKYGPAFSELGKYLRDDHVCFKSVSTYGRPGGAAPARTLKGAIWRTLTFRGIYEWTLKRMIYPDNMENGQALIRDFPGVARNGELMLVLGNPGSGCSTFLRIIGNDHSSFLGVKGSIDYSGLSPTEILKNFRGAVSYVPEDDIHLPTFIAGAESTRTDQRDWVMSTLGRIW